MTAPRIADPVLVTGANGFIGRRLVKRLLSEGYKVRALVLPDEAEDSSWQDRVEIHRGNMIRYQDVEKACEGVKTLIHLAAVVGDWASEELYQRVTVGGTENLMQSVSKNGTRVVLASSIVVYGDALGKDICDEEHPLGKALGPYSRSKQRQEKIVWKAADSRSIAVSIVRPANVYGPGPSPWVDQVIRHMKQGLPTLIGRGNLNAGLVHVDNVVDVLMRAASFPQASGRVYNACDEFPLTWRQYFRDLAMLADTSHPKSLPPSFAKPGAVFFETLWRFLDLTQRPPLTREALNLVGSHHQIPILRAKQELQYQPVMTYEKGLQELSKYIQESGLKSLKRSFKL